MSADHSILLMGYGQSNADIHDAGPRFYPPETELSGDALPVFMPDDGKGVRGYMGGVRSKEISGFIPAREASRKTQSLLTAAAARILHDNEDAALRRVIVRSEARGGRRFMGFQHNAVAVDGIFRNLDGHESIIFSNLIASIRECIKAARDDGCPISLVNMVWLHGESDRAMSRSEYRDIFSEFIDTVESRLADTGVAFEWTVVQPGGTGPRGGGNFWPNRLAVLDVADARDNVSVAVSGYAYEQMDGSHFSGYGKLLLGENIGRMIARRLAGQPHAIPRASKAVLSGQDVFLTIEAADPIYLDSRAAAPPRNTLMGFHSRDSSGAVLQDISVVGPDQLRLCFDRPPDPTSLTIYYAFAHNRRGDTVVDGDYPVGRGCLRTTLASGSCLKADETLHDWVAGFAITVSP